MPPQSTAQLRVPGRWSFMLWCFCQFFFQFLSSAVRIVSVGTNYQSDGLSSPLDGKTKFFFHCLEVSPATTTTAAVVSGWRSRRNSSSLKKKRWWAQLIMARRKTILNKLCAKLLVTTKIATRYTTDNLSRYSLKRKKDAVTSENLVSTAWRIFFSSMYVITSSSGM